MYSSKEEIQMRAVTQRKTQEILRMREGIGRIPIGKIQMRTVIKLETQGIHWKTKEIRRIPIGKYPVTA
jgi:hypothetical protein